MLRAADEMGVAPQFREDLEKWVGRLLSPEWEVVLVADDTLGELASVKTWLSMRETTITVCPTRYLPRNRTACHEVVHVLLKRMDQVAERMIGDLPEPLRQFARDTWAQAHEEVTEELARLFLRAYGESDGQATQQI